MPEMHYTVRWPDAAEDRCYSPSLVVRDLLTPGADYALADFLQRVRQATVIANERVSAKYGFVCSRANDQLAQLEARGARFARDPGARVHVLAFDPA
jgi:uncharacterized repeat protein (TIGR04042 family)